MSIELDKDTIHIPPYIGGPFIDFYTFSSEEGPISITKNNINKASKKRPTLNKRAACFINARQYCAHNKSEGANRLLYLCNVTNKDRPERLTLSPDEITQWVELCQHENMLPQINPDFPKTGEVCFDLHKYPMATTYLHLCCVRHVEESPWFVKTVLCLMKKGAGFFTAIAVASACCINNTGHHFIPVGRYMSGMSTLKDVNAKGAIFRTRSVRALYLFTRTEGKSNPSRIGFGLHNALETFKVANIDVRKEDIFLPETEERIRKVQ